MSTFPGLFGTTTVPSSVVPGSPVASGRSGNASVPSVPALRGTNIDLPSERVSTQSVLAVSVNATVTQTIEQILPGSRSAQSVTSESRGSALDRLHQFDPQLASNFQALLDLVARTDPEAAKLMERSLDRVLDHVDRPHSTDNTSSAPEPPIRQVSREQFQIAIEQTVVQIRANVDDGVKITAESVRVSFSANLEQQIEAADPLVLDLNGDGFETTTARQGHDFDLLGDGRLVRAATVAGGDGLLALDRNRNGVIDNGTELFGDQNGATDGFAELGRYDGNGDRLIDRHDKVYDDLLVFRDANLDGATDVGELARLEDLGVVGIRLDPSTVDEQSNGNEVVAVSSFVREDGTTGRVGELLLNYVA